MSESIQITVVCFAGLKEKLREQVVTLSLPANSTCVQFKQHLLTSYPEAQVFSSRLLVARKGSYLKDSDLINPGDELACFPPVSGG